MSINLSNLDLTELNVNGSIHFSSYIFLLFDMNKGFRQELNKMKSNIKTSNLSKNIKRTTNLKMATELDNVVFKLKTYKPYGNISLPKCLVFVSNFQKLVSVLVEIQTTLIGLKDFKNKIASQFKYFVVNYAKTGNPVKGDILNAVFYGPPGIGKTKCGELLAKFWSTCGCLGKSLPPPTEIRETYLAVEVKRLRQETNQISSDALNNATLLNKVSPYMYQYTQYSTVLQIQTFLNKLSNTHEHGPTICCPPSIPIKPKDPKFVVITRGDIVEKWQGHTAKKVKTLVEQYSGGVIMIDEAYNICNDPNDTFGMEAITEICKYMDKEPNRIRWILAGYKDRIRDNLFKFQPGLKRRCNWEIDMKSYTDRELVEIFLLQMKEKGYTSTFDSKNLVRLFSRNKELFGEYGGSTGKLCYTMSTIVENDMWIDALDGHTIKKTTSFTVKDVEKAIQLTNKDNPKNVLPYNVQMMYI